MPTPQEFYQQLAARQAQSQADLLARLTAPVAPAVPFGLPPSPYLGTGVASRRGPLATFLGDQSGALRLPFQAGPRPFDVPARPPAASPANPWQVTNSNQTFGRDVGGNPIDNAVMGRAAGPVGRFLADESGALRLPFQQGPRPFDAPAPRPAAPAANPWQVTNSSQTFGADVGNAVDNAVMGRGRNPITRLLMGEEGSQPVPTLGKIREYLGGQRGRLAEPQSGAADTLRGAGSPSKFEGPGQGGGAATNESLMGATARGDVVKVLEGGEGGSKSYYDALMSEPPARVSGSQAMEALYPPGPKPTPPLSGRDAMEGLFPEAPPSRLSGRAVMEGLYPDVPTPRLSGRSAMEGLFPEPPTPAIPGDELMAALHPPGPGRASVPGSAAMDALFPGPGPARLGGAEAMAGLYPSPPTPGPASVPGSAAMDALFPPPPPSRLGGAAAMEGLFPAAAPPARLSGREAMGGLFPDVPTPPLSASDAMAALHPAPPTPPRGASLTGDEAMAGLFPRRPLSGAEAMEGLFPTPPAAPPPTPPLSGSAAMDALHPTAPLSGSEAMAGLFPEAAPSLGSRLGGMAKGAPAAIKGAAPGMAGLALVAALADPQSFGQMITHPVQTASDAIGTVREAASHPASDWSRAAGEVLTDPTAWGTATGVLPAVQALKNLSDTTRNLAYGGISAATGQRDQAMDEDYQRWSQGFGTGLSGLGAGFRRIGGMLGF